MARAATLITRRRHNHATCQPKSRNQPIWKISSRRAKEKRAANKSESEKSLRYHYFDTGLSSKSHPSDDRPQSHNSSEITSRRFTRRAIFTVWHLPRRSRRANLRPRVWWYGHHGENVCVCVWQQNSSLLLRCSSCVMEMFGLCGSAARSSSQIFTRNLGSSLYIRAHRRFYISFWLRPCQS